MPTFSVKNGILKGKLRGWVSGWSLLPIHLKDQARDEGFFSSHPLGTIKSSENRRWISNLEIITTRNSYENITYLLINKQQQLFLNCHLHRLNCIEEK